MYRTALRVAGYLVQEAADGFEALRSLDADPPDLVVLDLPLPRLDGYAVRQELKSQAHTRHIPIVVVTGAFGAHDISVSIVSSKSPYPRTISSPL